MCDGDHRGKASTSGVTARVSCAVCGRLSPPSRPHSALCFLKHSRTTVCEFLVRHEVLTADDVLACGFLCVACLSIVRRCDRLDSALNFNVKRLRKKKTKAAGGSFEPYVALPPAGADASNDSKGTRPVRGAEEVRADKTRPTTETALTTDLPAANGRTIPPLDDSVPWPEDTPDASVDFDFGSDGDDVFDLKIDSGDEDLGDAAAALLDELRAPAAEDDASDGTLWSCPACPAAFTQRQFDNRTYHKHMWTHTVPADAKNPEGAAVNAKIHDAFLASPGRAAAARAIGEDTKPEKGRAAKKVHKCPHCDHVANHSSSLCYHVKSVHSSSPPFPCGECKESFASSTARKTHKLKVHLKKVLYQCHHCDKGFYSKLGFEYHLKSLSDNAEKKMCEKCGVEIYAHKFNQHVADVHKAKRVYRCPHCKDVAYSHKRIIDKHLALVHGIGTVKANPADELKTCQHCGKGIKRKEYFVAHMFEEHGVRLPELKELKCLHCDKVFYTRDTHRRHVAAHTADRKFTCPMCQYSSNYPSNLASHLRRRHGRNAKTQPPPPPPALAVSPPSEYAPEAPPPSSEYIQEAPSLKAVLC